jgi:glycyl-tRNA synthetase (class II)
MGIKEDDLRYRDHDKKELAFYSKANSFLSWSL